MTTCCPTGSESSLYMLPGNHPGTGSVDWTTTNSNVERYLFEADTLTRRRVWMRDPALIGTRQYPTSRNRIAVSYVTGEIVLRLRAGELRTLLPKIIGVEQGVSVPYTYETTATDPPYFNVLVDKVNTAYDYKDLKIARAIIRTRSSAMQGNNPQPAELRLQVLGIDRDKIFPRVRWKK